ncbi:hypothetical protein [Leminorella richardii]|uniref:hypothetical protein n=1 Tax=Leminorella richardii TaxID=158841 RepID=UPI001472EA26|nr:hypothetical protein [Leminorella richardii]
MSVIRDVAGGRRSPNRLDGRAVSVAYLTCEGRVGIAEDEIAPPAGEKKRRAAFVAYF